MKSSLKFSFITTVYNEEANIQDFLDSLLLQTKKPDEIIIVDGGSSDKTIQKIKLFEKKFNKYKLNFKLIIKRGNRSVGRNEAIENAKSEIILCSDSGNVLDKDWVKNITKPFNDTNIDVVAGYYIGKAITDFQKSLIPYVLVMDDKVNKESFLPATRSIAFKKTIWKKIGGFNEKLSHNEDYIFARSLITAGAKTVFAKDALVYWIPRTNLKQSFIMFFRFALGDVEANVLRPKVVLVFIRYILALYILFLCLLYKSKTGFLLLLLIFIFYVIWAILKNYKYIKAKIAIIYLPLLQFIADLAVLTGTSTGFLTIFLNKIKSNKLISLIILTYVVIVLIGLQYGTPNNEHPFLYNMDEWHQLEAVKAIVKYGTTTVAGAAQIPFLYPVLSGLYLVPFILLHIVNPFSLKSPLENMLMQQRLFEILRSINIWFGIGSILLMVKIAKNYFKINNVLVAFFFTISPIFILLSGYFKYDVALLFWIILSLFFIFKFANSPNLKNFIYASIASALAFSTKFSAIPLVPLLFLAFILCSDCKKKYKFLLWGGIIFLIVFLIFGIPNALIGRANYQELLVSNLIQGPQETSNFILNYPWWLYLSVFVYPVNFGHALYILGLVSFFYILFKLLKSGNWTRKITKNKNEIILEAGFILFILSLISLQIGAIGNRLLVLLPFISLFACIILDKLRNLNKYFYRTLVTICIVIQFLESGIWVFTNLHIDDQLQSSLWIEQHIKRGTTIGIENIPIYQKLPNIILKEFYISQYKLKLKNIYKYQIVDQTTRKFPSYVVLSDSQISLELLKESPQNDIVNHLKQEGYKKVAIFTPDFAFFHLIGNIEDYYISPLTASPTSIVVYKKI